MRLKVFLFIFVTLSVYLTAFSQKKQNLYDTPITKDSVLKTGLSELGKTKDAIEALIKEYEKEKAAGLRKSEIKKFAKRFEDLLNVAERSADKGSQLRILPYLKALSEEKKDTKEAELYAAKIKDLESGKLMTIKPIEPPTTEKAKTVSPSEKRDVLPAAPSVIVIESPDKKLSEAEIQKLEKEKKLLAEMIKSQESAVKNMSAEQAKTSLMLLRQKFLLDSFSYQKVTDSLALVNKDLEIKEKQNEVQIQSVQKQFFLAVTAFMLLLAGGVFYRFRKEKGYNNALSEKNTIIAKEKERSEELLLNILPMSVAEELKQKGKATARYYTSATVMFTDFKGFTEIATKLSPEELVADLDYCFKAFDKIILKYNLEKIKTIGDSYMVASGIPDYNSEHAKNMVLAAKEILNFMTDWQVQKKSQHKPYFEIRIGIHSGPLVAGVVGTKKFAYDIWGDTVNVASRMESSSEAGKINLSKNTYEFIKNEVACSYRGKIEVKNRGEVEMYFAE